MRLDLRAELPHSPTYELVPRAAGQLACGEVAREPNLDLVRVAGVAFEHPGLVHLTWRDDNGPCTAAGNYPLDVQLQVQMPSQADRLLIRQGVDQAEYLKRDIPQSIARLIALHLSTGPRSTLETFAEDGSIPDALYDELGTVLDHRPYTRRWVSALARYCVGRSDPGPVSGWFPYQAGSA